MFPPENFVDSGLTFDSLINFEFIFVYGVVKKLDYFACSCLIFPTPFIEEAFFSPFYILASFAID